MGFGIEGGELMMFLRVNGVSFSAGSNDGRGGNGALTGVE